MEAPRGPRQVGLGRLGKVFEAGLILQRVGEPVG
jgi:hypothetical protein